MQSSPFSAAIPPLATNRLLKLDLTLLALGPETELAQTRPSRDVDKMEEKERPTSIMVTVSLVR